MLTMDPQATLRLTLRSDADKPNPPTLIYRYGGGRRSMRLMEFNAEVMAISPQGKLPDNFFPRLYDQIRDGLIGWEHIDLSFDPAALEDLLELNEAFEIFFQLLAATRLSFEEKKRSPSPSESNIASSAAAAVAIPAAAAIPSTPDPRSASSVSSAADPAASSADKPDGSTSTNARCNTSTNGSGP